VKRFQIINLIIKFKKITLEGLRKMVRL